MWEQKPDSFFSKRDTKFRGLTGYYRYDNLNRTIVTCVWVPKKHCVVDASLQRCHMLSSWPPLLAFSLYHPSFLSVYLSLALSPFGSVCAGSIHCGIYSRTFAVYSKKLFMFLSRTAARRLTRCPLPTPSLPTRVLPLSPVLAARPSYWRGNPFPTSNSLTTLTLTPPRLPQSVVLQYRR